MLRKLVVGLGLLVLVSPALARVTVTDRWRYTPFAAKDAVAAEHLLRYTFAAAGERLRFEVRVDGQVVARFAKRTRGELAFAFRVRPQVKRGSGLVVASHTIEDDEAGTATLSRTRRREGARTVTATEVVEVRAPRTQVEVALELPFAGVRAPLKLTPRLALFSELEAGRSYELLAGRWGAGHVLVVYVTPLAD